MKNKYKIIEPSEDIVDFYNKLWNDINAEKRIKIFEGGNEIDISPYLPSDIGTNSSKDAIIKNHYSNNETSKFLKSINDIYHTLIMIKAEAWEDKKWYIPKDKDFNRFIETCKELTGKYTYSFATKVFSFVDKKEYPILDSISVSLLNQYYEKYFDEANRKKNWGEYQNYINDYKKLLEYLKQKNLITKDTDFKEFDIFLWTYGTVLKNYWKKKIDDYCFENGIVSFETVQYKISKGVKQNEKD